jgi:hypothetical protein
MIYVFKTSVNTKRTVQQLRPYLNRILKQISWNFDLEDRDKILRLDACATCSAKVVRLLLGKGFQCSELED